MFLFCKFREFHVSCSYLMLFMVFKVLVSFIINFPPLPHLSFFSYSKIFGITQSQKRLNVYLPVLRDLLTEESCVSLLQGFRHNDFSLDSQDESLQRFVDDGQQVVESVHFLSQNRHQGRVTDHCIYCFLYN